MGKGMGEGTAYRAFVFSAGAARKKILHRRNLVIGKPRHSMLNRKPDTSKKPIM